MNRDKSMVSNLLPIQVQIENDDWCSMDSEYCYQDEVVTTYRGFAIALCVSNGGILAVTIWNEDKSVIEAADTELFRKYEDEDWHIEQAKVRINQLLTQDSQLSLSFE
jgi:hypothetical protein